MNKKALFFAGFLVACSEAGALPDNPFTMPPQDQGPDAGQPAEPGSEWPDPEFPGTDGDAGGDGDGDAVGDGDAEVPQEPVEEVPTDELGDILESIAELTTCKPSEINPVMDCLSVTCEGEPLSSLFCIVTDCLPLIEKVNPKCGDCMMAAISQDTLGLLNCVDVEGIIAP